ncbi:MAG: hypothetical protein ACLT33_07905 [Lachnospira pectinoschiza]
MYQRYVVSAMNALSTKNTGKYLEIVMRLYSSCKIPANEGR